MAVHGQTVNLLINNGRQLWRSLVLLAHVAAVFVAFVVRFAQCMVTALKWASLFARYTMSVLDSIFRLLNRWERRGLT